jgi:hypothetical protein
MKFAMQFKAMWMCGLLFLGLPAISFAGGNSCAAATGLLPDGRVLSLDYVQPGGTVWYSFPASSGHSYSIEVRDDLDSNPSTTELAFTFYSAACTTPMTAAVVVPTSASGPFYSPSQYRDTSAIEPKLVPNTGMRVSVPNPNNDTIAIQVVNSNTAIGHYVSVSVSETTLYDPAVITNANMNNFYAMQNTTSVSLNGVFTFRETWTGALIAPSPIAVSLNPNASSLNTSPGSVQGHLNLTRGKYGSAIFTHDGPPGAFVVTATIADFSVTPPYVQATSLAAAREAAH